MSTEATPLPKEFLNWQVALRLFTMTDRNGSPHIGVVPTVTVKRPGAHLGVIQHSIVCGLLPSQRLLAGKTAEFRDIYENHIEGGARAVYDIGVQYLLGYYVSSDDFDPGSVTSLVPEDCALVDALKAEPKCTLSFNVFAPEDPKTIGAPRCQQLDCTVDILSDGPVYENVWWHNTIFHGMSDEHVVLHFKHQRSWDTRFGGIQALRG
jgi:hypothetical protein